VTDLRTQSRLASFIEAVSNTVIGFFISVTAQWFLFMLYGIKATPMQFVWLSIWMTVLSVVRSYVLRRMWNAEWWTRFKRKHTDKDREDPPHFYSKAQIADWFRRRRKLVDVDPEHAARWLKDIDPVEAKRWLRGEWDNENDKPAEVYGQKADTR
jgi:hypothetical protein